MMTAIEAWFTPTSSGGKAREVLSVTKDTIAPEATLGISDEPVSSPMKRQRFR